MDASLVVVELSAVDHPTGFFQAQDQLLVQGIVTQLAARRLDLSIFPRASLGDEQRPHLGSLEPAGN